MPRSVSRDTNCHENAVTDRLPIDLLQLSDARPAGFIPRASPELIERVRRHGPIDPVVVRPIAGGRYEILSNPEAWVATGRAGRHEVPVVIRDDLSTELAAEIVREQYGDRRAPSAIDEAQRFMDELQALGGPGRRGAISRVAAAAGRARAYVAHALRLLELPEDIQALVRQGVLSPGHVRPLVSLRDPVLQRRLARTMVDERLSVRAAERLVRGSRTTTPVATAAAAPSSDATDLRRLESRMTELIGCPFQVDPKAGRATIQYFGDLEILQGVLERLGYQE
jgi:ParB family chromosome partitioning protein